MNSISLFSLMQMISSQYPTLSTQRRCSSKKFLISSAVAFFNDYGSSVPNKKIKTEQGSSSSSTAYKPLLNRKIKKELPSDDPSLHSETFCKICMEAMPASELFFNPNCSHSFCFNCIQEYIGAKIRESISAVKCPEEGCKGMLEPEYCQEIIPKEVFERWGSALCESMVLGSNKFSYCPFKDCSALLLADVEGELERVKESECPSCRRMFCAECGVVWHSGLSCVEFQSLGADERGIEDVKMLELVKRKKWKRCPNCKLTVEKTDGGLHITCRCKFQFCYGCGRSWSDSHASCSTA